MSSQTSIFASAQRSQRAEEFCLKVRGELYRIGAPAQGLHVLRQGPCLRLSYRGEVLLADPAEILLLLKKTERGLSAERLWERICARLSEPAATPATSSRRIKAAVAYVLLLLLLLSAAFFR